MPTPYASATVSAPVDAVWSLIRDFNGLPGWHPAIAESEIEGGVDPVSVGAVRHLRLADGGEVRERLVTLDDVDRRYTYEFVESPYPVRKYRSTIRVAPITTTGESFVEWWSDFESEAADEAELTTTFGDGVYATGIEGLRRHFDS
ncbi:MAG: SRPBCC family protein [Sciscionella sp.]